MNPHTARIRWAAIGAAIAIALGAGSIVQLARAAPGDEKSVYVPMTPCRLLDTRSGTDQVGARGSPLTSGETMSTQVRGTNGNCTIPTEATGVGLNVTIVNPTADSFLTVFPSDATRPLSSNLNWVANQRPTPNVVTSPLAADGSISLFNFTGTVDLAVDVAGYYVAEKPAPEVLVGEVGIPMTLATGLGVTSIAQTIESTTAGYWTVTKTVDAALTCGFATGRFVYLMIDGIPVRGSAQYVTLTAGEALSVTLSATETRIIPAGSHVVDFGAQCLAGASFMVAVVIGSSATTVVVTPP